MLGIAAAQRAGKRFGRPPSISDAQWSKAKDLLRADPPFTVADIATLFGVSRQAIYRRLERERVTPSSNTTLSSMLAELQATTLANQ